MQKISAKIITALLLGALFLTLVPLAFASLGTILIDDSVAPQALPITPVPAGGNINLYFGDVTFSGSQFYLLLSQDGLSQMSTGDIQYTPLFNVAAVQSATVSTIAGTTAFPGSWTIGNNWINGSIPLNIAGGTYYIKAFDGFTTALAVTQGFPVAASLRIVPAIGAAGTTIVVSGNAFPANALVNLSYVNPITLANVRFANNTVANALGQFNYSMPAPDLMQVPPAGASTPATNAITFSATADVTTVYTATYTESQRGLVQIGRPRASSTIPGTLQNATGVYGNMSSFDLNPTSGLTTISMGVGQNLRIVGNSFYPGALTFKWDNVPVAVASGDVSANQTGWFNSTIVVPATGLGSHNITITDSGLQVFVVFVNVVQSITVTPTSGPIGTAVTVNGYGFPAAGVPAGNAYNVTIVIFPASASPSTTIRAWGLTDANGQFQANFSIPTTAGGVNNIVATANDTGLTSAFATFNVGASFTVSPSSFYANSSEAVVATGTGFDPAKRYYVAIDNLFTPTSDTIYGIAPGTSGSNLGKITFTFIQAGFQPGLHVVALYEATVGTYATGPVAPAANATFTVLGAGNDMLTAINATTVATNNNVAALVNSTAALLNSINGTVATINTKVGQIQVTVNSINASLVSISNGMATVSSSVGTLTTSLSSISGTLSSVSGTMGTVSSTVGSIQTSLSSLGTKVTSIEGNVATVQTDVGTIKGTVTETDGKVATIQTDLGTLQADVSSVDTSVKDVPNQVNVPIWIAVVLALVAAIAAIASLLLVRRKIAG